MIQLLNIDNLEYKPDIEFDVIYADMIYENEELDWIHYFWRFLKPGGIFIVQTDWHTDYLVRYKFEHYQVGSYRPVFLNHLVWKAEWGNHPKDRFHQCYDDILIYKKGNIGHKFYSDRIQIDKVTKNKGLNPSGRDTKTATAFISDITLTTTSKERVKKEDGHLIKWQKPISLMNRILLPFTDENDYIFEPFGGTFPACRWAKANKRNAVGIELDKETFELGKAEVEKANELPVQMRLL